MRANVYFTREITPEKVVELYRALGVELPGKVAVKVLRGEGQPEFPASGILVSHGRGGPRHHRGVQYRLW